MMIDDLMICRSNGTRTTLTHSIPDRVAAGLDCSFPGLVDTLFLPLLAFLAFWLSAEFTFIVVVIR